MLIRLWPELRKIGCQNGHLRVSSLWIHKRVDIQQLIQGARAPTQIFTGRFARFESHRASWPQSKAIRQRYHCSLEEFLHTISYHHSSR